MFPETIEEYVSEAGIDLKTLFDPVNGIIYMERADGTYEARELTAKNRSGFVITLPSATDFAKNGIWDGNLPALQQGEATTTSSSQLGASDFVLYGAGYDSNGAPVFEAGFKPDINYVVLVTAQWDSSNSQWNRTIKVVVLKGAVDDVTTSLNDNYGAAPSSWTDLSAYEEWMAVLGVTRRGKGLVDVDTGADASTVNVSSTDGDLEIDANGNLILSGNAPVL